jgi:hypothetical protein
VPSGYSGRSPGRRSSLGGLSVDVHLDRPAEGHAVVSVGQLVTGRGRPGPGTQVPNGT